jgi:hypothetical protein
VSSWPIIAGSGITGATAIVGYLFGDRSSEFSPTKRFQAATVTIIGAVFCVCIVLLFHQGAT